MSINKGIPGAENVQPQLARLPINLGVVPSLVPLTAAPCKKCGPEAACMPNENKTSFQCICPHDHAPPAADGSCPKRRVVPHQPISFQNVVSINNEQNPLRISSSTVNPTNNAMVTRSSTEKNTEIISNRYLNATLLGSEQGIVTQNVGFIVTALVGVGVTLLLALLLIVRWRRRNMMLQKRYTAKVFSGSHLDQQSPVSLSKGSWLQERLTPNPQYELSSNMGWENLLTMEALRGVNVISSHDLLLGQELGEGCFGRVFKGTWRQDNGRSTTVAIKVLKDKVTPESAEDWLREAGVMASFRHENILSLLGLVSIDNDQVPSMVFQYMPYGDLTGVLRGDMRNGNYHKQSQTDERSYLTAFTQRDLLSICEQIARGMCYLSTKRFVHRDLACRNCLVGDGLQVKISDFGMSRDIYTCDYYKIGGSRLLPVRWMAPESILYGKFTPESDVWSFGIVLWEVFSLGKQPYYGHSNEEVVALIMQGTLLTPPSRCPYAICDIMRGCWKSRPQDRLDFPTILQLICKAEKTLKEEQGEEVVTSEMFGPPGSEYLQPVLDDVV